MKATYRNSSVDEYWNARWESAGPDFGSFENTSIYPIKYALDAIRPKDRVLEVGFGSGRLLFHLSNLGCDVIGVDNSEAAAQVVAGADVDQLIAVASVQNLPFIDDAFDVVLAFGVVHGIEAEPQNALHEMARVLCRDGRFAISLRANNIETRVNDLRWRVRNRGFSTEKQFHKWRFDYSELRTFFEETGLVVEDISCARNVPNLFRIPWLRRKDLRGAPESVLRSRGFELNSLGKFLDKLSFGVSPKSFCSIYCVSGYKGVDVS